LFSKRPKLMPVDDPQHHEVRAAKVSIDQTPDGVTLLVEAGDLRLRLFIDGQFSDLLRQIRDGEGELGHLVPFQMKPISLSDMEEVEKGEGEKDSEPVVSTRTVGAHPVPGFSEDKTVYDTPLWQGAFKSLRHRPDQTEPDS
jgi:hypothetical protein